MPFGKELSHLIEEQINKAVEYKNTGTDSAGAASRSGVDEGRIALLEANLQRLAEQFTAFIGAQKQSKRNIVDYGLDVIALHGLRLAVTAGRAIFTGFDEPLDLPYTYLQLTAAGAERQIRYIYLDSRGVVLESTTDPTNMGADYLPLAMVDVWSGVSELTQEKIKDLRPRAGAAEKADSGTAYQLTGNATLYSPDTGNDSFIVSAEDPAGLMVNVSSGKALVDGEILNAEGGMLDLTNHRQVVKEFIAFSDGETDTFNLYHQAVSDVVVYVDDEAAEVTVDEENGSVTFAAAPAPEARIEASYTFGGNYMLLFLVEKALTSDGSSFGVLNWRVGSNRSAAQPPDLPPYQHAIAKVDMSGAINAITDEIIDNSYEVRNLTQYDLQYGENLDGSSLKAGAITGEKIAAHTIIGDHILAGSIESANIKTGAITADKIAAGAIAANHIAANAIKADMIDAGSITADKFESITWGDLSQAMRFVKAILGGEQAWQYVFSKPDLAVGEKDQVTVSTWDFPAIRLDTQIHWDDENVTWDTGTWDIPVYASGYWESASMDYGLSASLQAEFWAVPLIDDPAVAITVKAKYSEDNANYSDYEVLERGSGMGYYYWTGTLRQFRYFKIRVEFATTDTNKYTLLAHPEARAANCQIGTEDISDTAVTAPKLAGGSVTASKMADRALDDNIAILTGSISHGGTIPLPAGYTQDQCKWMVSFYAMYFAGNVDANDSEYCYTDANRVVYVYGSEQRASFIANYLIIGVK